MTQLEQCDYRARLSGQQIEFWLGEPRTAGFERIDYSSAALQQASLTDEPTNVGRRPCDSQPTRKQTQPTH
jgi:hypothetical protein